MMRRLIATIDAEVGRNSSDTVKAALVESLLNRQNIRLTGALPLTRSDNMDFSDLNRLGLLSTGRDNSYYQPFRSYHGRRRQSGNLTEPWIRTRPMPIIYGTLSEMSFTAAPTFQSWFRECRIPGCNPWVLGRVKIKARLVRPRPARVKPSRADRTAVRHFLDTDPGGPLARAAQTWVRGLQPQGYVVR
jgi:hypothetical protein